MKKYMIGGKVVRIVMDEPARKASGAIPGRWYACKVCSFWDNCLKEEDQRRVLNGRTCIAGGFHFKEIKNED